MKGGIVRGPQQRGHKQKDGHNTRAASFPVIGRRSVGHLIHKAYNSYTSKDVKKFAAKLKRQRQVDSTKNVK
jgi:hypothetical protein